MKTTKITAFLLAALVLFGSINFVFADSGASFRYGDVDGDMDVDSTDYAYVRQYLLGMIDTFISLSGKDAADVEGDIDIDSTDYAYIRQYLLGQIDVFPAELKNQTPTATPTTVIPTPTPTKGSITLELDKTAVRAGEVVKATLKINNIQNFAGYQVNIKYDPTVLQPVDANSGEPYTNDTMPLDGTLLTKATYTAFPIATHDISSGILNFTKAYMRLDVYRASGKPETTGSLAIIGFKVLKMSPIYIKFQDTNSLPKGITGTMLDDWDGNQITSGYSVIQPSIPIYEDGTPLPTQVITPLPTYTPTHTPTPYITPTYTPAAIMIGDVDGNGVVDSTDRAYFRQYLLGMVTYLPNFAAADANHDGQITQEDMDIIWPPVIIID